MSPLSYTGGLAVLSIPLGPSFIFPHSYPRGYWQTPLISPGLSYVSSLSYTGVLTVPPVPSGPSYIFPLSYQEWKYTCPHTCYYFHTHEKGVKFAVHLVPFALLYVFVVAYNNLARSDHISSINEYKCEKNGDIHMWMRVVQRHGCFSLH